MTIRTIEETLLPLDNQSKFNAIKEIITERVIIGREAGCFGEMERSDDLSCRELFIYGRGLDSEVPNFNQPLYIEYGGGKYLVSDLRMVTVFGEETGVRSKNIRETLLIGFKSHYMNMWVSDQKTTFLTDLSFAGKMFVEVISNALASTFSVAYADLPAIKYCLASYYATQFLGDGEVELDRIEPFVYAWSGFEYSSANYKQLEAIGSITELSGMLSKIIDMSTTPLLRKRLDMGSFITMCTKLTFGVNMPENLTVSMFIPAIWAAIVSNTLDERSYANTRIGDAAKNARKNALYTPMIKYVSDNALKLDKLR